MKRQSKIFRSRFRMLVEAQLDLLKNDDWDYLLNYDIDAEKVTQENFQHLNSQDITPEEQLSAQSQQSESVLASESNNSKTNSLSTSDATSTSENVTSQSSVSQSESTSNK